jgi:hypothetical protein
MPIKKNSQKNPQKTSLPTFAAGNSFRQRERAWATSLVRSGSLLLCTGDWAL